MLRFSPATKIYLARDFTDMRKGFSGLYGLAQGILGADPTSGHLFVFCNRDRNRIKVFYWDGSGFWVCAKRLERGRFSWPGEEKTILTHDEFSLLVGGLELSSVKMKKWFRR